LRELHLNGYIDDDVWFGDEITPEGLHEVLYGEENEFSDDVHIRLNSFGGSCNAATRMYDDIRAYPGNVAADRLEMTPGSLWMIHDPSIIAWGNERDLTEAIGLLRACKESILNIYAVRCKKGRGDLAAMMTATSWMDAKAALAEGFIDGIAEDMNVGLSKILNHRSVDIVEAEAKVKAWLDRRRLQPSRPEKGDDHTSFVPSGNDQTTRPEEQGEAARSTPEQIEQPEIPGTPIAQLQKRLGLLMPTGR